jgi:hypothetical protein
MGTCGLQRYALLLLLMSLLATSEVTQVFAAPENPIKASSNVTTVEWADFVSVVSANLKSFWAAATPTPVQGASLSFTGWLNDDSGATDAIVARWFTSVTTHAYFVPGVCSIGFWTSAYLVAAALCRVMNIPSVSIVIGFAGVTHFAISGCFSVANIPTMLFTAVVCQPMLRAATDRAPPSQILTSTAAVLAVMYNSAFLEKGMVVSIFSNGLALITIIAVGAAMTAGTRIDGIWFLSVACVYLLSIFSRENVDAFVTLLLKATTIPCPTDSGVFVCALLYVCRRGIRFFSDAVSVYIGVDGGAFFGAILFLIMAAGFVWLSILALFQAMYASGQTYTDLFKGFARHYLRGLDSAWALLCGERPPAKTLFDSAFAIVGTVFLMAAMRNVLGAFIVPGIIVAFVATPTDFYRLREPVKAKPSDQKRGSVPPRPAERPSARLAENRTEKSESDSLPSPPEPAIRAESKARSIIPKFNDICVPFSGGYAVRVGDRVILSTSHQKAEKGANVDGRKINNCVKMTQNQDIHLINLGSASDAPHLAFSGRAKLGTFQELLANKQLVFLHPTIGEIIVEGTIVGSTLLASNVATSPGVSGSPLIMHRNLVCGIHQGRGDDGKAVIALIAQPDTGK